MDSDGHEQDVGFAKPAYVQVSEPALPLAQSRDDKKDMGYFG